jgi:predicted SprT family Zn-dependent metalloprotease
MLINEASKLALHLMGKYGLREPKWTFRFNRRWRSMGMCFEPTFYKNGRLRTAGRIELSVHYVILNPKYEIQDTILHEIAHALVGVRSGHNEAWRSMASKLGARPGRINHSIWVNDPKGLYEASCAKCLRRHRLYRKPKAGKYTCVCGEKIIYRKT